MNKNTSITISGGGIVGCVIAYELSLQGYSHISVLERNPSIPGLNQSSTNEGTIHSGVYYPKDIMPLKAKLCVEGNTLMYEFLEKYNIPHKKVGKLIIGTNAYEEEYLDFFLHIGIENGVRGIKKITGKEAQKMEPNIQNVTSALYIPSAGSTSPKALIQKVKLLAEANGVSFLLDTNVTDITADNDQFKLTATASGKEVHIQTDILINSAGLYSDTIATMVNPDKKYEIDPARGEFFQFDKSTRGDIWMNGMHIYQPPYCYRNENGNVTILAIPAKELPELLKKGDIFITAGVHLSPSYDEINGKFVLKNTVTISPLKTIGLGKEDYTSSLHTAADYIKKVHYFFPNLRETDIKPDHTGIMSPLKGHRDFVIEKDEKNPNFINLIGMESPAWTSSFAIAKYVTHLAL